MGYPAGQRRSQPSADPSGGWSVESAGVLESIAEVAIALAGFGGIAAALGYRARGEWSRDDRLRLILLALTGLTVVFGCFLPYAAHYLGSTPPWRIASALLIPFPVAIVLFTVWRLRHGFGSSYSRIAAVLTVVIQVATATMLLVALLGHGDSRQFGFYLTAVLLVLLQAGLFFVRLLITSFRSREPAA